ncbi:MAG: response regulator [Magnetococcales bacterium]|nr:response regulator [Magnetococcales bacterium]
MVSFQEQFQQLRSRFASGLPGKIQRMVEVGHELQAGEANGSALEEIHVLSHGLLGTAASFDYPEISGLIRPVTLLVRKWMENRDTLTGEALAWLKAHLMELGRMAKVIADGRENAPSHNPIHYQIEAFHPSRPVLFYSTDDLWAENLAREIQKRACSPERCDSLEVLHRRSHEISPVGIIIDLDGVDLPALTALFSPDPHNLKHTPVPMAVVADREDLDIRLAAVRLGSTHFYPRPVDLHKLVRNIAPWSREPVERPFRVLVVDDDDALSALYRTILQRSGMEVATLNQPAQVLEEMARFDPELVVLDLFMPGCNGIELACVLRQHPGYANLPVLFVSAEQNLGRRLSDRNLAHEDHLIKPIRPAALVQAVLGRIRKNRNRVQVTEHLHASLQELENMQFALNHHASVCATDIRGRITFVNQRFCQISGYSPQEIIGQDFSLLRSDDHPPVFFEQMWQTISQGQVWHGQIRNRCKDQSHFWVDGTIVPFLDEAGQPLEFVAIFTDISRQKRAEEEARGMALFAVMNPEPVLRFDREGIILEVNPAATSLFGVIEKSGQHLGQVVPGLAGVRLDALIRDDQEVALVTEMGGRHYHLVIHGVGDMGVGHLYSRDITEWKMAEETLEENENRLRAIVASAREGIIVTNEEGRIELFNPAAECIFGLSARELLGEPTTRLFNLPPGATEGGLPLACLASDEEGEGCGGGCELEGIHQDGSRIPLWFSGGSFGLGGKRMYTGVVSDITPRKRVETELRLAKESAEKANRAKSLFLSSMSHELRTPMNAVLGFAQLLESDPLEPLSESQLESVEEIIKAGNHLLSLINEILDLAKIEAGRVQITLEEVALRDVVEDCLSLVSSLANKRGITFSVPDPSCHCDRFMVQADRTRLKQVLLNLLSNAIKYNEEEGGVSICCARVSEASKEGENARVRITVSDTGRGIPAAVIDQVFEPFNRLGAEESDLGGTGIGLAISKRLVELMGGTINVESREGEGSTFWIDLVLLLSLDGSEDSEDGAGSERKKWGTKNTFTVLYVEDNPANLKLVGQLLKRRAGVELLAAPAANLGLDLARVRRPDLILLDINLPGMNGFQVLERLQKDSRTRHIPVVALSVLSSPSEIRQGMAAGFFRYLTKPLEVSELLAALDDAAKLSVR